jgi:hypothetical protein
VAIARIGVTMTAAWRFGCKFPDGGLLRGIESILKSTRDDEIANCILERQVQVSTDILSWWFRRLCVSFFPMSVASQIYRMRGPPDRSGGVGVVIYRCAKGLLSELPWFQKDHQMG